jgi:serine-type D-Ala-D-Ala endopeptidase (penicillin-binding protein 7)
MRSSNSRKKDLGLAVVVAAIVAAAGLLPLAYQYGQRPEVRQHATRIGTPAQPPVTTPQVAPAPAPAPGAAPDTEIAAAPTAPGAEEVPVEESETDRGASSASPAGPTLSSARAAGLHLAPDPMHLNSAVALVMDQETGQVLARKNDEAVLPIASLTKIMTALLVLEARQPMDEVITISEEDVDNERHSRSRLRVGTTLTREEALHLALMSSENRAAHALGRTYPGGLPKMVERMNARARELGMKNTTYVDPTGLSNRNQSTAQDLALLLRTAVQQPVMRDFSTTPTHVASLGGRTLQYRNSNRLIRNEAGWDIGLQKTGYIVEAGRCLTMVTKVAGHNLVMVLLDAGSNGERIADAQKLRRWVVAQNGWQDDLMLASAKAAERKAEVARARDESDKEEKRASAKKRKSEDVVAKKDGASKGSKAKDKDVAVAKSDKQDRKKKANSSEKLAKKPDAKPKKDKDGRVKQTFAGASSDKKS